jgi:hypothetical protein
MGMLMNVEMDVREMEGREERKRGEQRNGGAGAPD